MMHMNLGEALLALGFSTAGVGAYIGAFFFIEVIDNRIQPI